MNEYSIFCSNPLERYEAFIKRATIRGDLQKGIDNATNYFGKLQALRNYYLSVEKEILEAHNKNCQIWQCSYPMDWSLIQTPIEQSAWQSIRGIGRVVLYPQYPALNYHLDFGNPGFKIGLEIDGKNFHTNKERDLKRDTELKKHGWTIYRVSGAEMMRTDIKDWQYISDYGVECEDEKVECLRDWILHTGEGVITAIRVQYFETYRYNYDDYLEATYVSLCKETLMEHRLI